MFNLLTKKIVKKIVKLCLHFKSYFVHISIRFDDFFVFFFWERKKIIIRCLFLPKSRKNSWKFAYILTIFFSRENSKSFFETFSCTLTIICTLTKVPDAVYVDHTDFPSLFFWRWQMVSTRMLCTLPLPCHCHFVQNSDVRTMIFTLFCMCTCKASNDDQHICDFHLRKESLKTLSPFSWLCKMHKETDTIIK